MTSRGERDLPSEKSIHPLWLDSFAASDSAQSIQAKEIERVLVECEPEGNGIDGGLEVHAGHGPTNRNIARRAATPGFSEFNIGHSIVSRAVFVGTREAVREMKRLLTPHAPKTQYRDSYIARPGPLV